MTDRTTPRADDSADPGFRAGLLQKTLDPLIRAVRQEVASARAEIGERISAAKTGVVLAVVGALLGVISLALVAALAVELLALILPLWAATAITLVVFLAATGILLFTGLRGIRRGIPPVPTDTLARRRSTDAPRDH
jgi:hypothetical protein